MGFLRKLFGGQASSSGDADGLYGDPDGSNAGGGIYGDYASPTIINNIITGNKGGGIESFEEAGGASPRIIACNIWNNPDPYEGEVPCMDGCISQDPLFADAAFRLSPGSPCEDSGREDDPARGRREA